jgi:hypothetical protein
MIQPNAGGSFLCKEIWEDAGRILESVNERPRTTR